MTGWQESLCLRVHFASTLRDTEKSTPRMAALYALVGKLLGHPEVRQQTRRDSSIEVRSIQAVQRSGRSSVMDDAGRVGGRPENVCIESYASRSQHADSLCTGSATDLK